jgi:hypothetical protein
MATHFEFQPRGVRTSPLFVGSLVGALASTVVLTILTILQLNQAPPRGGDPNAPTGGPPPPPPQHLTAGLIVVAAIFVVAWTAVLLAIARDTIMRRLDATELRVQEILAEKISEYGDLRETDGYVWGMRQAGPPTPNGAEPVRTLYPVPPVE